MINFPLLLPFSSSLLRNPENPESVHPLLPQMKLTACKLLANSCLQTNFRKKTFDIMLASWKMSTQRNYASTVRQCLSFCTTRHFESSAPFVTSVLNFLTLLYERGIGHSQIDIVRSALSVIYPDIAISKHPLISRFVQGVQNLHSGQVKYPLLWDAQDFIRYHASWNLLSNASFQDISRKLAATLAFVSVQRVHTLSLIYSRHIFFFDSGTYLYIFSDLKLQRDRPCFVITLPSESEIDCLKFILT